MNNRLVIRAVSCLALFGCLVLCGSAPVFARSPFNEDDIYIIGDIYQDRFGRVTSIREENGKVTVTITDKDGKQKIVTESPQDYQETAADSSGTSTEVKKIEIGTVRVRTSLNVRTGPWGQIIDSLYGGDQVKIVDRVGVWYRIVHKGRIAFIHSNYVDAPGAPAGQVPVVYPWQMDSHKNAGNVAATQPATSTGESFGAAPAQPMPSRVSSEYGMRIHPITKVRKMHYGVDLPIPNGTRLNALGNGTVVWVGYNSGCGRFVRIRYDNGLESSYCHNQSHSVKKGDRVRTGQEVARSDNTGASTGPHLHFGMKKNGRWVDPRSVGVPLPPRR